MTAPRALRTIVGVAVLAVLLGLPLILKPYGVNLISMWAVTSMAAVGLNLTLGYAGQVSLAQGAFVGIGAYTMALLSTHFGWPLLAAIPVAAVICFAVGWGLGYPALRVQHHYLAFVTLAFSTLVFLVLRNEAWLTNGVAGIDAIPRPHVGWLAQGIAWVLGIPDGQYAHFERRSALPYYYLCLAALAVVILFTGWLVRSPWGRAFMALRENPVRALSLGIDTRRYTLMAFAIGSALGGIAGAFYAPLVQYIEPGSFTLTLSLNLLMMVIVGGSGYFYGPLLGALVAVLLPEWLRFADSYYLILYALFVMVLLAYSPRGILGILDRAVVSRRVKAASAARAAATALITPEKS